MMQTSTQIPRGGRRASHVLPSPVFKPQGRFKSSPEPCTRWYDFSKSCLWDIHLWNRKSRIHRVPGNWPGRLLLKDMVPPSVSQQHLPWGLLTESRTFLHQPLVTGDTQTLVHGYSSPLGDSERQCETLHKLFSQKKTNRTWIQLSL